MCDEPAQIHHLFVTLSVDIYQQLILLLFPHLFPPSNSSIQFLQHFHQLIISKYIPKIAASPEHSLLLCPAP